MRRRERRRCTGVCWQLFLDGFVRKPRSSGYWPSRTWRPCGYSPTVPRRTAIAPQQRTNPQGLQRSRTGYSDFFEVPVAVAESSITSASSGVAVHRAGVVGGEGAQNRSTFWALQLRIVITWARLDRDVCRSWVGLLLVYNRCFGWFLQSLSRSDFCGSSWLYASHARTIRRSSRVALTILFMAAYFTHLVAFLLAVVGARQRFWPGRHAGLRRSWFSSPPCRACLTMDYLQQSGFFAADSAMRVMHEPSRGCGDPHNAGPGFCRHRR